MIRFQSIRGKLLSLGALSLSLVLVTAFAGWWSIDRLNEAAQDVTDIGSALKSQQEADMMHDAIRGDLLAAQLAFTKKNQTELRGHEKDLVAHAAKFTQALVTLKVMPLSPEVRTAVENVLPSLLAYELNAKQIMSMVSSGREPDQDLLDKFSIAFDQAEKAMGDLSVLIETQADIRLTQAQSLNSTTRLVIVGVALFAGLLLFAVSWGVAAGIVKPIRQALQLTEAVANGDLTSSIDVRAVDETGQLLHALQNMSNALMTVVTQVRSATDSINTASSEIASGNQDLSARTEQTVSNLEETAASMEQLTSTVRQSADSARQANQLAASASEFAVRGGQVVSQVVSTMEEINTSSQKISDIIGVIDGIAFQTNILALNAAVEAARAGEQGRGFAVVAGEVRNLAQRSAEAAKEIKGLIGTSVDKVETGSRLVAQAGQAMSEIVGSVQRVSDIIGEISAAAGEQSDGIGQVNIAVNQLDQMTQQNAALVEQSAAAAESLKDQASRLASVVQVFRLSRSVTAIPLSAPAPVSRPVQTQQALGPTSPRSSKTTQLPPPSVRSPRAPTGQAKQSASDDSNWESF